VKQLNREGKTMSEQAYCRNENCEYYDQGFEDNCSAPEEICNNCMDAEWSDEEEKE